MCLLVCTVIWSHFHKQSYIFYHHFFFLVEFNIDIHIVYTFQRIFFPFVHMSFANLVNSKCLLSEWAKKNVIFVVDFQRWLIIGNFNKVCIAKLVWWVVQWTFIKWRTKLSHICIYTPFLLPWNTLTPSTPKHVNLWAIWFFHKSPSIIKTFIIALVKLSPFDPSTT